MTYFDIRIPGLKMTVVAADGQYVNPVPMKSGLPIAETYDVIPDLGVGPYHLAQSMRTGPVTLEVTATREG